MADAPSTQAPVTPAASAVTDGALLSFVAAFVDTCGFIGLYGVFTAHVTGNFVLIGSAIVSREGGLLAKLLVLPVFIAAVAATYGASRWCERHRVPLATPALACESLLLLATIAATWDGAALTGPGTSLSFLAAVLLAASMGVQNALNRLSYPGLPPTTVMTGNVTHLAIDAMVLWTGEPSAQSGPREEARRRVRRMLPLVIAFTLGAAAGAAGFAWAGFASLILPAALCVYLATRAYSAHR